MIISPVTSIGLEIEFSDLTVEYVQRGISNLGLDSIWNIVHDASVESPIYRLGNSTLLTPNCVKDSRLNSQNLRAAIIGGELVSRIIDTNSRNWENCLGVLDVLLNGGEESGTVRDSMHIHVNMGTYPNISVLLKLVKLWKKLEHYLYRLGGMGYTNRGETNRFTFQRPLNSPPYVLAGNSKAYPVFVLDELLNSKSITEFMLFFGDIVNTHSIRYVPQRYVGLNFQKLYTQGSVEFRIFNKSLSKINVLAVINLCQAIVESAFTLESDFLDTFDDTLLGSVGTELDFEDKLNRLLPSLGKSNVLNIIHLYQKSGEIGYKPVPTYSHLSNPRLGRKVADKYSLPYNQVETPNRIDVHVLEREMSRNTTSELNDRITDAIRYTIEMLENSITRFKGLNNIDKVEKFPYIPGNVNVIFSIRHDFSLNLLYATKSGSSITGSLTINFSDGKSKTFFFETFPTRNLTSGRFINIRALLLQVLQQGN